MVTKLISELPMIRRMGRNTETDGRLNLFWTASGIDFCFRGTCISAQFTTDYSQLEQWIAVEVDGYFLTRMPLPKGTSSVSLLRGLSFGIRHRIRIFKEVQVMPDDPDNFMSIDSLSYDGEIFSPPKSHFTIEFVGDSITSGEGTCGAEMELDWISPYFGVENNYARMTADALRAEFRCVSQSGWGVLSDYKNNPYCAIPFYYGKICGVTTGSRNIAAGAGDPYDFSQHPADFVVVNLGTNDDGAFHSEPYTDPQTGEVFCQRLDEFGQPELKDSRRFEAAVVGFLGKLRTYNPDSQIIWCYGMLGDFLAHEIAGAVKAYQSESGDTKVHFLLLPPVRSGMYGSREHPGRPAHEAAAKVLTAYIRQLAG